MTQADLARIAAQMGLDRPLPIQYWDWFSRTAHRRLGPFLPGQPAGAAVIASHLSATLELMIDRDRLIAVHARLLDRRPGRASAAIRCSTMLATVGAMIALSIPTFWFGLVVIYVFSVKLGWLPAGNHVHHRRRLVPRLCRTI